MSAAEASLTSQLLAKPVLFTEVTTNERLAIEHLCNALELVKTSESSDTPTLDILGELYPLCKGWKRYRKSTLAESEEKKLEGGASQVPSAPTEKGELAIGEQDAFSFEDESYNLTPEEEAIIKKIEDAFMKLSRNPNTRKPNFRRSFEEMDSDGSGKLDYDELKFALQKMGIDLNDDEMAVLLKRLDTDGDGDVDYIEFMRFVKIGGDEGDGATATSKVEDALSRLSRAIFLLSDHNFFNMRAECYFRLHDLKSCVSNLRYVLKLLPGDQVTRKRLAKVIDLQGINWMNAQNFKAASTCFAESSKLDPIHGTYWIHQSVSLVYEQDFNGALRCVEQSMSVEKATADVYCLRGKIHWALELTDAGNRDFRSAQELEPEHPEVVEFLSHMIKESGSFYKEAMSRMAALGAGAGSPEDSKEAIRLLTQALSLVPDDMRLLILRAKAYRALGDLEKSLTDIDNACFSYCQAILGPEEVPKFVPNRRMWLETQQMKNLYREPVILTQQRSLTLNEMAMAEVRSGNHERAIGLLNRVIEQEWQVNGKDMTKVDAKYFVNRGDCYRATGKIEQAMSDFHRAYDSDPTNWQTKTRLSMIHYMAGLQLFNESMYQQAEVEFTVAIKYNSKVSGYYAARGKACYYQHNYDCAYDDYVLALKLDPQNKDVQVRIQQFDPEGKFLDSIGAERQKGLIGNIGMDLENASAGRTGSLSRPGRTVRMSKTAPPNIVIRKRDSHDFLKPPGATAALQDPFVNTTFFPNITPVTSVNHHLGAAATVKTLVTSKRSTMRRQLGVEARRKAHPIQRQPIWSVMVPKKVEYKSMTNRKKMLKEKSKGNPKKNSI